MKMNLISFNNNLTKLDKDFNKGFQILIKSQVNSGMIYLIKTKRILVFQFYRMMEVLV